MTGAAGGPGTVRVDPDAVRATLRAAGLRARHSLSQNFLADPDVLDAILAEADPGPGRGILEIGPGLGLLTGALLASGAEVTAVELDRGLAAFLRERFDGIERCAWSRATRSTRTSSIWSRRRMTWSRTCRTTSPARSCTPCSGRRRGPPGSS